MRLALCDSSTEQIAFASVIELPAEPPEWVDLMSEGELNARDGRRWTLEDAAAVVAASRARAGTTDPVVDYEHQTYLAEKNGQPAPASGWIKELRVEDGTIQGRIDWTQPAAAKISAREYRYLSPAFYHDKKTMQVRAVTGAALTNNPALDLPALATANNNPTGENSMEDKDLKALREALGLATDADATAILAAVAVLSTNSTALAKVAEKVGLARDASGDDILAAAHAAPASGDFVPREQYDQLANRVRTLETGTAEATATAAVDAAVEAGKVTPANREWALGYAKSDAEGFRKFVEAAPVVVTPGRTGPVAPNGDPDAPLTADELATCRSMDISEDDFKAARKDILGRQRTSA